MLDGLPPLKSGCKLENYGYSAYKLSDRNHELSDFDLCREFAQRDSLRLSRQKLGQPFWRAANIVNSELISESASADL
jgi:hypothetical protein